MSSKKAVVVNLSSSGSRLGGAAIAAEWHARFMANSPFSDYPVELWRMWDDDEVATVDNLTIHNYTTHSKVSLVEKYLPRQLNSCFLSSNILSDLKRQQPGIVHLQNPIPALEFKEVAAVSHNFGAKVVASTHGFFEVMNPNFNLNFIRKYGWKYFVTRPVVEALEFIDVIVSGYPQEKVILEALGVPESKIKLVPNGIDPFFASPPSVAEIEAVLTQFQLSRDNPILLFIGNHNANKGIDVVLEVAAKTSKTVSVVIGGQCRIPNEAEYWCQKIPPASNANVIFTDYLTLAQQRVLYHISTLLLFPSLADTLPLTILEAMASGLAVVAYDVGGISYQLDEQSGVVVPFDDRSAFLDTVETLLEKSEDIENIEFNAKIRQESLFTWDIAAKKTLEIYRSYENPSG